jgi:ATP-dependent Clp protease ATP-binding subunit ClpC
VVDLRLGVAHRQAQLALCQPGAAAQVPEHHGHNEVDTEHLLLALLEQPAGEVPAILEKLGADAGPMARQVDAALKASQHADGHGDLRPNQVLITSRVQQVLERANEEATRLQDKLISAEYLFLAIAGERDTPAARLLTERNVTRERIYDAIQGIRGSQRR